MDPWQDYNVGKLFIDLFPFFKFLNFSSLGVYYWLNYNG